MPYTLMKGLAWLLIALLLGVVIGWLLRSIAASRQLRQVRADKTDNTELERLRARVANLEPLIAERDRIAGELAGSRERPVVATAAGVVAADIADETAASDGAIAAEAKKPGPSEANAVEATPVADQLPGEVQGFATVPDATEPDAASSDSSVPDAPDATDRPIDVTAAAAVLGKKIKLDDLTVVEGIGPAISGLCNGIGIHTWAELAGTEVSLLRTMLADAGSRFRVHEPDTWPDQAGLLASGQWSEFKELTSQLAGGRSAD